jgi:hypothetical protein
MCVVVIVPEGNVRPTEAMLKSCWNGNPDGGGIGWVERAPKPGINLVKWRKGIGTVEEMIEANKTLPKPYVLHFRIPSVGGKSKELTHPFPLSAEAELALEGDSYGGVLFHNGTWGKWEERLLQFTYGTGTPLPDGQWSDTRAMAYLAYHLSPNILEFIDEKIAILVPYGPDGVPDVLTWGHWNVDNGIITSNTFWKSRMDNDRRWLPAHYKGRETSQNSGVSGRQTEVVYPPVRQHNEACVCEKCIEERAAGKEVLQADPTVTPGDASVIPGVKKITLEEIKLKYHKMSKNQLRRLKKKDKHNPKQMTTIEKWTLRYADIQDRKKLNAKMEKDGRGHLSLEIPALTLH